MLLATGFMVQHDCFETLYAVLPDGRIYMTTQTRPNSTFGKGQLWTRTDEKPAMAEFIGNYCTSLLRGVNLADC